VGSGCWTFVERRRVGEAGGDENAVVHIGFEEGVGFRFFASCFGERAHVSRNQYSRISESVERKRMLGRWRGVRGCPNMDAGRKVREARRHAAPSKIGVARADGFEEGAKLGAQAALRCGDTFRSPIFGCALFARVTCGRRAFALRDSTRTRRTSLAR